MAINSDTGFQFTDDKLNCPKCGSEAEYFVRDERVYSGYTYKVRDVGVNDGVDDDGSRTFVIELTDNKWAEPENPLVADRFQCGNNHIWIIHDDIEVDG